jgi:S-adenosylmethionine decarboxylase
MQYEIRGREYAVDIFDGDFTLLNSGIFLYTLLQEAAEKCGATVLTGDIREFEPQGITVYLLLAESHICVHTYPEKGFMALSCYTCGDTADPKIAVEYVIEKLDSKDYTVRFIARGR